MTISDAFVSENTIFILDNISMKILCYDMDGHFRKKIDIRDLWAHSLFFMNENIYLINKWSKTNVGYNRLFVLNQDGEMVNKFLPFDEKDTNRRGGKNICYSILENKACIYYMSDYNIYEISDKDCVPKYNIDFLNKAMSVEDSEKSLIEMIKSGLDKKYVLGIDAMSESSNYIFLSFLFKDLNYTAIYDKTEENTITCQTIINSSLDKLGLSKYFVENDDLYSVYTANNLIASYNYVMKDLYKKDDKFGKEIKNIVSDLTEMSNDIIIKYKLKNNENQ